MTTKTLCPHCGYPLVPDNKDDDKWDPWVCNGVQTLGGDPYREEINDDYTEYLMCEGARHQSAQDI